MKKNKGALIALAALVCVALVFAGAYFATRGSVNEGSKELTLADGVFIENCTPFIVSAYIGERCLRLKYFRKVGHE